VDWRAGGWRTIVVADCDIGWGKGGPAKKKKKKRSTAETRRDEADWGSEANEREPIKASWSVVVLAQGE